MCIKFYTTEVRSAVSGIEDLFTHSEIKSGTLITEFMYNLILEANDSYDEKFDLVSISGPLLQTFKLELSIFVSSFLASFTMSSFRLLALVSTVLIGSVIGKKGKSRCRFNQQMMPKKIAKFESECLNKGFRDSTMDGCEGNMEKRMKKREHFQKCTNLDKYLQKCGHNCLQNDTDSG